MCIIVVASVESAQRHVSLLFIRCQAYMISLQVVSLHIFFHSWIVHLLSKRTESLGWLQVAMVDVMAKMNKRIFSDSFEVASRLSAILLNNRVLIFFNIVLFFSLLDIFVILLVITCS